MIGVEILSIIFFSFFLIGAIIIGLCIHSECREADNYNKYRKFRIIVYNHPTQKINYPYKIEGLTKKGWKSVLEFRSYRSAASDVSSGCGARQIGCNSGPITRQTKAECEEWIKDKLSKRTKKAAVNKRKHELDSIPGKWEGV